MRYAFALVTPLLLSMLGSVPAAQRAEPAIGSTMIQPASDAWPNVFVYRDKCNVYLLREGDSAILFNLGDGSILDHLKEIGVKNIEWVIFSDHHREQCQGVHRINRNNTRLAAPKDEQALFE